MKFDPAPTLVLCTTTFRTSIRNPVLSFFLVILPATPESRVVARDERLQFIFLPTFLPILGLTCPL
jgi:hypothetical protein